MSCLASDISAIYKELKGCDLTIQANDGTIFRAHKLVLASRSKFFMKKYEEEMTATIELVVKDISPETLGHLLR
jgi:hypothetical protein